MQNMLQNNVCVYGKGIHKIENWIQLSNQITQLHVGGYEVNINLSSDFHKWLNEEAMLLFRQTLQIRLILGVSRLPVSQKQPLTVPLCHLNEAKERRTNNAHFHFSDLSSGFCEVWHMAEAKKCTGAKKCTEKNVRCG